MVQPKRKTLSELLLRGFFVPRAGVENSNLSLTSEWLALQVERTLHPAVREEKEENNFFEDFDQFLEVKKLSEVRTRNFRVIYRAFSRYREIDEQMKKDLVGMLE